MTVLVCAAHADDEVIGLGGTIAKLAKTEDIVVVVFYYGANLAGRLTSWPPTMSQAKLTRKRVSESQKAGELLGVKETIFLGLVGDEQMADLDQTRKQLLSNIFKKYSPNKVFYHSIKDGHKDHRFVNRAVSEQISKLETKPEIYTYQVNLFDFSQKEPKIIFDVSHEFSKKLRALEVFKTQPLSIELLKPLILLKAMYYGKKFGMRYAEYFMAE